METTDARIGFLLIMNVLIPIIVGLFVGTLFAWLDGLLDWLLPERFKIGRYDFP